MDNISEYEFAEIFDRISSVIDLQGKLTVHAINAEIVKARDQCRKRYFEAETMQERHRCKAELVRYNNLLFNGFANRTIKEAMNEPNGFIAMTLRFGKLETKRRLLAQRDTRTRIYRRPDYRHGR
jgi:hypothetical protein